MSAFGMKITNPHYSNMVMPPADQSVRDWPKWVYPNGPKSGVIVHNAEEEAAVLAAPHPAIAVPAPAPVIAPVVQPVAILTGSNDEKTLLLALAKEKGIKVDARWNLTRLRGAMDKACPE